MSTPSFWHFVTEFIGNCIETYIFAASSMHLM